jgi:hypothetical protein
MLKSEAPDSPASLQRRLTQIAAEITAARTSAALPRETARHLDSARAHIEALQSCCPCGPFRQYLETLGKASGPDRFARLVK